MKEIWKSIEGYEGLYQVSNLGSFKSLERKVRSKYAIRTVKEKILKQFLSKYGYLTVGLSKNCKTKRYQSHRLVAIAFISNPNNYPMVNHKDENRSNPKANNLEWCTSKYNNNYGTKIERYVKTRTGVFTEKMKECIRKAAVKNSIKVYQYSLKWEFVREWDSMTLAQKEGFRVDGISRCCKGKRIKHKGYKWSNIKL